MDTTDTVGCLVAHHKAHLSFNAYDNRLTRALVQCFTRTVRTLTATDMAVTQATDNVRMLIARHFGDS
jgi:hypothetical protein